MIIGVVGQVLALGGLTLVALLVNRFIRIELTLSCLIIGFLAGLALPYSGFDTGIRAESLQELVFFVILPVLIFEAAWYIKPAILKAWLAPILLLATLGVLVSMFISAALIYLGVGHPTGFPWIAALLTGAILAATDPIAVISQLRAADAPEDLTTLFEGESLFNDASAVALFLIIIAIATQVDVGEGSYIGFFSMIFVGGVVFGLIAGLLISASVLLVARPAASQFILVLGAFATFYVAEHVLHVSGIMAVTLAAIVSRFSLNAAENSAVSGIGETWEWLGLSLTNLLFVIMGLVITVNMFQEQWLAMLIAIAATLLARVVTVTGMSFLSRLVGKPLPAAWQLLLVWGGLRGAIAIALVLALPTSLPYWWTIQSMVFGVVVFSLLVQGTTNKYLVTKYAGVEHDRK